MIVDEYKKAAPILKYLSTAEQELTKLYDDETEYKQKITDLLDKTMVKLRHNRKRVVINSNPNKESGYNNEHYIVSQTGLGTAYYKDGKLRRENYSFYKKLSENKDISKQIARAILDKNRKKVFKKVVALFGATTLKDSDEKDICVSLTKDIMDPITNERATISSIAIKEWQSRLTIESAPNLEYDNICFTDTSSNLIYVIAIAEQMFPELQQLYEKAKVEYKINHDFYLELYNKIRDICSPYMVAKNL